MLTKKKKGKVNMSERIAKFMARSGVCSRREAEELIRQKRVTVNGEIVASPALNVDNPTILTDKEISSTLIIDKIGFVENADARLISKR